MTSKIFAFVRFVPLAIFLFVAVVGAFAVLIGGSVGWVEVTEYGKLTAGGGALGFFGWLLVPGLIRAAI